MKKTKEGKTELNINIKHLKPAHLSNDEIIRGLTGFSTDVFIHELMMNKKYEKIFIH